MVQGLKGGVKFLQAREDTESLEIIRGLMPGLTNTIDADLHRFRFRDVISTIRSFQDIFVEQDYQVEVLSKDQLATLHRMCNKYLVEYIEKSKQDINGHEYANLIEILRFASEQGFGGIYEDSLIERLVQVFIKDQ